LTKREGRYLRTCQTSTNVVEMGVLYACTSVGLSLWTALPLVEILSLTRSKMCACVRWTIYFDHYAEYEQKLTEYEANTKGDKSAKGK
jgi:hypothetical protein